MQIRNNIIALGIIGIIIVGILYFFQNQSPREVKPAIPPPRPTFTEENAFDEKGPKVGLNLTLSPIFLNIILDPKQIATAEFKITNNNLFKEDFRLKLVKFKADESGKKPVPIEISSKDELNSLVKFKQPNISLQPNETRQLSFSFTAPKTPELGYYFAIMVIRQKERQGGKDEAIVAGAPLMPVLIEVRNPYAKKEIEIKSFKAAKTWYEYLPVEFETVIANTGNVHVVPFGDIFIDQGKNKEIGGIIINETRGNILPQTERKYDSHWYDSFIVREPKMDKGNYLTDEKGRLVYETKWDITKLNKFRIGKYTATAIVVYNNGETDIPIEAKTSFWVIPWKIILGLIICLFLLFQGIKSSLQNLGGSVKRKR